MTGQYINSCDKYLSVTPCDIGLKNRHVTLYQNSSHRSKCFLQHRVIKLITKWL